MESTEIKHRLESHFLWQRNFIAVLFEMEMIAGFRADVVAITPERGIYEIEIKTDRADFIGEVNAIKYVLDNPGGGSKSLFRTRDAFFCTTFSEPEQRNVRKPGKHDIYLNKVKGDYGPHYKSGLMPSRFYFCLPYPMIEKWGAVQLLEGTPYGLMSAEGHVYRNSKKLHNEKMSDDALVMLMRKMSRENLKLRKPGQPNEAEQ